MFEPKEINGETEYFVAGAGYVSKAEYDRVEAYKNLCTIQTIYIIVLNVLKT